MVLAADDEPPPLTELIGAWLLWLLEQPASHRLTSESAATRRKVKCGLPALIYPPRNKKTVKSEP
ncbi:hypothetical protein [Mangrovibacter sp. MFB070]|uniref:hypothetical protein n=1 Tax=Mangrovibacter TaxID=451512 RepID=UPI0035106878